MPHVLDAEIIPNFSYRTKTDRNEANLRTLEGSELENNSLNQPNKKFHWVTKMENRNTEQ